MAIRCACALERWLAAISYSPRSPAKIGQTRPWVLKELGGLWPHGAPVNVSPAPVEALSVSKGAVGGRRTELGVDYRKAVKDSLVVRRLDPKTHQFEEAGINNVALVDGTRTAVIDAIGSVGGVGIAVRGQSQEVG